MTPAPARVAAILAAVVDLDDAAAARVLDQECGDDPELRAEVERLAHDRAATRDLRARPADAEVAAVDALGDRPTRGQWTPQAGCS